MDSFDFNKFIQFWIKTFTTQFFCFSGRMSRRDYWTFMIPNIILCAVLGVTVLVPLALLLPSVGATARRLHDVGKTGWIQICVFICGIGYLIPLFFCLLDGQNEANQYGEVPADESAA